MEPEQQTVIEQKITKITPRGNSQTSVLPRLVRALKTVMRAKYLEWLLVEVNEYRIFIIHLRHQIVISNPTENSLTITCTTCNQILKTFNDKTERYFIVNLLTQEEAEKKSSL